MKKNLIRKQCSICFFRNTEVKRFSATSHGTLLPPTPAPQSLVPCVNLRLMDNFFRVDGDTIRLEIKAIPGASKTELAGIKDSRLRIRLATAPEDGKANAEMLNFLSKTLGCSKRDLWIISGEKSRLKAVAIPVGCRARVEGIVGGRE